MTRPRSRSTPEVGAGPAPAPWRTSRPMHWKRALLPAVALTLAFAPAAFAGKPTAGSTTSTVDGFHTWNSDMVNMENITEDGNGVYVAVLDTGLVANWSDYFSKERVRADLGIGFEQSVNF